jgi:hypothetical protein
MIAKAGVNTVSTKTNCANESGYGDLPTDFESSQQLPTSHVFNGAALNPQDEMLLAPFQ